MPLPPPEVLNDIARIAVITWLVITDVTTSNHTTDQICVNQTVQDVTTVESRYAGDRRTAREIIGKDKRGKINSEFPEQWKDKTPDEIYDAARRGDRAARTAKKLLDSREYDK